MAVCGIYFDSVHDTPINGRISGLLKIITSSGRVIFVVSIRYHSVRPYFDSLLVSDGGADPAAAFLSGLLLSSFSSLRLVFRLLISFEVVVSILLSCLIFGSFVWYAVVVVCFLL
jgi:hypothetical protein